MSQVSQFQKQILSELGIVSWKLRDDDNAKHEAQESSQERLSDAVKPQTAATPQPSGLSGLELIKQQMAKSGEAKTPAPQAPAAKISNTSSPETTTPAAAVREVSVPVEPVKPVLEFKSKVLLWQSTGIPLQDIQLALNMLAIPFQLVTSDSELVHRFPLLVAAQTPQKLVADKLIIMQSPETKKQLWQALMDFKQAMDKTN